MLRDNQWYKIKRKKKSKAGITPILLIITLSLIVGILFNYYFPLPALPIVILGTVSLLSSLLVLFFNKKNQEFLNSLQFFCIAFFMGCVGLWIQHSYFSRHTYLPTAESAIYRGTVKSEPTRGQNVVRVKIEATACYHNDSAIVLPKTWVMLSMPIDEASCNLLYGDEIVFSAKIAPSKNHHNIYRFDYDKYLLQHAIGGSAFVKSSNWKRLSTQPRFSIQRVAFQCRRAVFKKYETIGLKGEELALLSTLTLGKKELLSKSLREEYSKVGAAHILAVSGMHVGIIFLVLSTLLLPLDRLFKNKNIKPIIIILFLWFYAFVVGFSPSIVRACMLISLAYINRLGPQGSYSLNFICFTAWLDLLFNPMALFDLSFLLSYSAVTAILIILPSINNMIRIRKKWLRHIHSIFWMSIAAQFATAPIIAYFFHHLSLVFLTGSFLVIPMAYLIIFLTIVCLAFPPSISTLGAIPLNWLLRMMNHWVEQMADWPAASFPIWISNYQAILWAIALMFFMLSFFKYKSYRFLTALGLCCLAAIPSIYREKNNRHFSEEKMYVTGKNTVVNVIDNARNINLVYTTDSNVVATVIGTKWDYHNCARPQIRQIEDDAAFVRIAVPATGVSVGFLQTKAWLLPEEVTCDVLVLAKEARVNAKSLDEKIHCQYLVTDGATTDKKREVLHSIAQQSNLQLITNEDYFGYSMDLNQLTE